MRGCIGTALTVAVLLAGPRWVDAQAPVAPMLGDGTGSFAPGPLPAPVQDPTNPAGGPVQAPTDDSNTTIVLAPQAGLGALLGNNASAINTTIVQQLTFTGAFAQSVDSNLDLVASQLATINALPESQVETTSITYVASTTIVMPGAAIDIEDIAVTNAMAAFLVAAAQNVLPNATADVAIPDDFTVAGDTLQATLQFSLPYPEALNASAPNATLTVFVDAVTSGAFDTALHQAASDAVAQNTEGGTTSTIPAETLVALETCQVSILAGSTTLEPTAQVQVNVTVVQPDIDAGLSFSSSLKRSVSSGRLGTAISSAVGYDVAVSSDADNRMYVLAQAALTQAQIAAGITTPSTDNSKASPMTMPFTSVAGAILLLSLLA